MITLTTPDNRHAERHYALSVLLEDFLGLTFKLQHHAESSITLKLSSDATGKKLTISDDFFQKSHGNWLNHESLPLQPLQHWNAHDDLPETTLVNSQLPIIYGEQLKTGVWFTQDDQGINLGLDIIGSAFFMLTRYEEIIKPERDQHDRFPAKASLAYQEGFLERPIINEYLEILWSSMVRLWPQLKRKPRSFEVVPSHDVDHPFSSLNTSFWDGIKTSAADLIKRRNASLACKRFHSTLFTNSPYDPYDTFDWIMDQSERNNLISSFYFLTDKTDEKRDGTYTLDQPGIKRLLRRIHHRGHRIGLHPSYNTSDNPTQIRHEFSVLQDTLQSLGIKQDGIGGRQHYLRWSAPTTWQAWQDAALAYDSTVGYAQHCGFRSGVCYDYPAFNLWTRLQLGLRERPLIVMEGTLLGEQYMNLSHHQALARARTLRERCRKFEGRFTVLWHNSYFTWKRDRLLYSALIRDDASLS